MDFHNYPGATIQFQAVKEKLFPDVRLRDVLFFPFPLIKIHASVKSPLLLDISGLFFFFPFFLTSHHFSAWRKCIENVNSVHARQILAW